MSESHAVCLFTEGRITLPDQYQDRTVGDAANLLI